jgi:Zn-dependent M28 family amino/carboxypeptidase
VTVTVRSPSGTKRSLKGGNLKSTKGGARRTLTLTITVATTIPAGTYTLTACVRRGSGEGRASCRNAGRITIVVKPSPAPAPQPAPTPTPAPVTAANVKAAVNLGGLVNHLRAFQEAADLSGGNRASGLQGYGATLSYVVGQLRAAGYNPQIQTFDFPFFKQLSPSVFAQTSAPAKEFVEGRDFDIMSYSGTGDATAELVPVDLKLTTPNASTSGCEAADFPADNAPGAVLGKIALMQRGTCGFGDKVRNAQARGAVGAIVMNQGDADNEARKGRLNGTLGQPPARIPAIGIPYDLGVRLAGGATVRVKTETQNDTRRTNNVIAETAGGNPDKVVIVGSHLDSVPEGPGVNDNGTGSAFNLELALQMAKMAPPNNKVRFAWWGAEESGLIGSTNYVTGVPANNIPAADLSKIMLNLNFDMLGSPNHAKFVYDGDFSDTAPPASAPALNRGSQEIEQTFKAYFDSVGLATEPSAFDGRSDYKAFQDRGIPAGGLFTGAEVPKTAAQAGKWGGIPGRPFDPNYHGAGDDINNVDLVAYEQMADAAAYVAGVYANRTLNPTANISARSSAAPTHYRGHRETT